LGEEEMVSGVIEIEFFFSGKDVDVGDGIGIGACKQFKKYACSAE